MNISSSGNVEERWFRGLLCFGYTMNANIRGLGWMLYSPHNIGKRRHFKNGSAVLIEWICCLNTVLFLEGVGPLRPLKESGVSTDLTRLFH